jgi:CDP-glycerol glycerophosphotransferase
VDRVSLESGEVVVDATATGLGQDELAAARWRGNHVDLPATSVARDGGSYRIRFATPPPSGRYTLTVPVPVPGGGRVEATAATGFAHSLPRSWLDDDLRLTLRLRPDGVLVWVAGPPLDDEERRPDVQRRARRAHRIRSDGPHASAGVLLHQTGGTVGGGPAALDSATARTRPDVARSWAVLDRQVAVPAGAASVIVDSRRWYDLLAAAPMLWTAGDLPAYFEKHERQRTLQTFDGYPTAAVGLSAWQARGQSAGAVAREVARRQRQWDALVAPTEAMATIYRREFEFDGAVLITGYPHTDNLVTRDRDTVRAQLLARLGVPVESTVVLYAPAHRDRATRALLKGAPPAELDVPRLAAALGPSHVVLTIGVPRGEAAEPGSAPVIDVTVGPAVNDLLLAADAAVLDYSALRFDWALTGRPGIFHVPDHDEHLASVAAPVDYDSTAVGPRVSDLDGVLDALDDLAGLRDRFADAVDDLNATYNALHDGHAGERVVRALLDPAPTD